MGDCITHKIKGIKCDNPECDYVNKRVNDTNYEKYLNKPCPKCGQILLTEKDYNAIQSMLGVVKKANIALNPIDRIMRVLGFKSKKRKVHIEMDGTGKMDIEKVE